LIETVFKIITYKNDKTELAKGNLANSDEV